MNADLKGPIAGCMRWGKWGANFSTHEYRTLIQECIEHDITTFDHADIYGDYTTEQEFGEAIKGSSSLRDQIKIITKCGIRMIADERPDHYVKSYDTSRDHIIASVERSLKNFYTDHIDLLLIHRPDPLMDPHEIAEAVHQLRQQGKLLHFGVSNFLPHQKELLMPHVELEFDQLEISILNHAPFTNGIIDHCYKNEIRPMAWAPLGGGIMSDDTHPRYRAITAAATKIAEAHQTGINQVLIAWLLQHPSRILPVVGTTKIERLIQARDADKILLDKQEWFALYSASLGEEIP